MARGAICRTLLGGMIFRRGSNAVSYVALVVLICVCIIILRVKQQNMAKFMAASESSYEVLPLREVPGVLRFPADGFQPVFEPSNPSQILIYSAWYDARIPKEVRVVALARIANLPRMDQLRCVYYKLGVSSHNETSKVDFSSLQSVQKSLTTLNITTGVHRGFLTINCETVESISSFDWWLSIVPADRSIAFNYKPLIKIVVPENRKLFGVCIQPLHDKYSKSSELVQMIELNRILGADYFYFYNFSVTPEVDHVLRYYATQTDFVEVLPWNFDTGSLNVGITGQKGALADCQRRLVQNFKYFVYVDLDEFIVPRTFKTWTGLYENFMVRYQAAQYVFANVYFLRKHSRRENAADSLNLPTLVYTERYLEQLNGRTRAKVIALSECVSLHYIHFVVEFLPIARCRNLTSIDLDPRVAFLHHFRTTTAELPVNNLIIEDHYVMNTYKQELVTNVKLALSSIKQTNWLKNLSTSTARP